MEAQNLAGNILKAVWFDSFSIDAAWVDEDSPEIATQFVNLEFSDNTAYAVFPCEIDISKDEYPALGIEIRRITHPANLAECSDGSLRSVQKFEELSLELPQRIEAIVESDPVKDGALSQITIVLSSQVRLNIFHTMPPITLGVTITNGE